MTDIVDVADLDCVYLSYDEPQKEEFWAIIQNMVPWAKRVDGVKGSDAAHKAAADISDTDRFILIDGDNLPHENFFNEQLTLDNTHQNVVFRWRAVNNINGLMYGNGGMSCWTRDFVHNMRTHEHSDGNVENNIEFCFYDNYWAMHNVYSVTYPDRTPYQAWRAGFREGVKMSLDRGERPNVDSFKNSVHKQNLNNLKIWCTIGRDNENGIWAMLGARMGVHMTMIQDWDHNQVQWFDNLQDIWNRFDFDTLMPETYIKDLGKELNQKLDLGITEFDEDQSRFFKQCLNATHVQKHIMTTEKDFLHDRSM